MEGRSRTEERKTIGGNTMDHLFDMPAWWWLAMLLASIGLFVGVHMIVTARRWRELTPASDEEIEAWERWFKQSGGEW